MLIIDVQSRRGAVEEVYVRDGDNAFDLARGFIIQAKVVETGYHVDVSGSCWVSEPTINPPAPAHQPNYFRDHPRSDSGSWEGSGPRQQHRDRGGARRVRGGRGVGTTSATATESGTTDCLKGEAEHAGSNVHHTNGAASLQPLSTVAAGVAHEAAGAEQEHAGRETRLQREEDDDPNDDDEEASFLKSRDGTSRHADRETCLHREEDDDPDDDDEEASFLKSRDDTTRRNGRRFEWRRRQWQQRRRCSWQDYYSEEDDDDMRSASTSGETTRPDGRRRGDNEPATATTTPAERRRSAGYRLRGRWIRRCGSGSEEESSGGWRSAPEVGHGGGSYRANRQGFGGGAVGGGAGWRGRGALGRRPASREAARQLRVSERMHRLGRAMAKRKEATRQRRDEVQKAREALACSGRLNLCSKTRELTDNQPKYVYRRPTGRSGASNGGSGYGGGVSDSGGREGIAAERGEPGHARGGEQENRGGGALYRGAGDRLYSEWMASRKRNASLLAKTKAAAAAAAASRENASPEGWTCPECGADNRAQDDTCQTFTGLAVAAQDLRPDTWCRESPEALGRVAAAAAAAATATRSTAVKPGGTTGDQRGPESRRRRGGGGGGGGSGDSSGSRRVGEDGVRRCGRRRPEMFRPTPVARPSGDGAVRARPKGELLFDNLYRNPPTPSRRRAKQVLQADTRATCTFAPEINECSRRLAEAQEARRDLLEFVRAGSESDGRGGGAEGKGGSKREDTEAAATRAGGGAGAARSKVIVKSHRLHAEHADNEQRRERRRKELLSQSCPFTPDIGVSAAWPIQETTTEDFVRRLHAEHAEQERRLQAKRYTLHGAPHASIDPATGRPFFSPMINKTWAGRQHHHHRRQSGGFSGWFSRHGVTKSTAATTTTTTTAGRGAKRPGDKGKAGTDGRCFYHDDDDRPIHASLWERGLALERRREADARSREEARKSAAAAGHVGGRSAELIRAMRVRSLVQTYRTLLASVEYARLPEGLDYDEAMESITSKINAIFDNDNDAWQEMTLEVAKADPSVLKPELVPVVTSALAGHGEETLSLLGFCELLDAAVENLASAGGPTAHLFAPGAGRSAAGADRAAAAAAAKAAREDSAELKEMTFRPRLNSHSKAIARTMGRDGTKKKMEDVRRRENIKSERRRSLLLRQQTDLFSKQHPFTPTFFSSTRQGRSKSRGGAGGGGGARNAPRYPNEIAADRAAAEAAAVAAAAAAAAAVGAAEVSEDREGEIPGAGALPEGVES
ncbi:hypothetical protein Esi_0117_0009 [Ectocarpus siliculosus]|uniref:Uncharacterized protein n=1 Tax=Ectocarpus siliculosus TaxID=2880 RepID=D7FI24_ECTSI|nr:hypothetical protein Esi_0117_0009 [Ectocarpus siliculosus]|eukprot:CBJ28650.1 hypothetical protein Esi_0117_0009 [Ectocarpus siliculosus]